MVPSVLSFFILAGVLAFSSATLARSGDWGEALGPAYRTVPRAAPQLATEETEESDVDSAPASALQLALGGSLYESKYRTKIPTMKQAFHAACNSRNATHRRSLCRSWPEANRSFEAAAKAFRIPAPALVCLMKAETNFVAGLRSDAGASGLTQFMPATARYYQRLMNRSDGYQERWKAYRQNGGTDRARTAFNAFNILSSSASMMDVQIFATAMYFAETTKGKEAYFRRLLGAPPEPNGSGLRTMMHYWLAAYNGGPLKGERFLVNLRYDRRAAYARLPYETQNYIRKFDQCMNVAARY